MPPTSADGTPLLVDTSVAVALVVADHDNHAATIDALAGRRLGLSGHAVFETYSVLTRLPGASRRSPAVVARVLEVNFPETRYLSAAGSKDVLGRFATAALAGGQVYDALVAAAAVEHELALATRDRRALGTYRSLAVDVELL